jgi:chromosome segregation ATPase
MTNEQWEAIYNAAYAVSDAWKKEREDLIASRNHAVLECRDINKECEELREARDYWKGNSEQQRDRMKTLEEDIDELTAANQRLADQRDQDVGALGDATEERDKYKQSREYWKNLYDQERNRNHNLETENLGFKRTVEYLQGQAAKDDLDPYKRLDALESAVGVNNWDIYNLLLRVSKLETSRQAKPVGPENVRFKGADK